MSFCLMYCLNNELYVGADSRKSTVINGKDCCLGDNLTTKIIACKRHIVFAGGLCSVYERLLQKVKVLDEQQNRTISIEEICQIANELPKPRYTNSPVLGIIACEFINGKPVGTIIQEGNQFSPCPHTFTEGEYSVQGCSDFDSSEGFLEKASQWIEEYISCHPINQETIVKLYEDLYNHIQSETIGGTITIYKVNTAGTHYVGEVKTTSTQGMGKLSLFTWTPNTAKFDGAIYACNIQHNNKKEVN